MPVAGDNARPETAIDTLHARDGTALAVRRAEISRVTGGNCYRTRRSCTPQVDPPGKPRGILGRQKPRERCFGRARVGAPTLAVGKGEFLRLDHHMDRVGRQEAHASEIEMLDDLQLFEEHKTGRVWRRFEHGEAAIIDADRLLLLGLESVEIGGRHQASGSVEARR
jgi:hypothetical protein